MSLWALVGASQRADSLLDVLTALDRQTRRPDGILIIESAAAPGVLAAIDAFRGDRPDVEVLSLGRNGGSAGTFAAGLTALAARDVEAIVCFDDDAVPQAECLEHLKTAWRAAPGAAVVGAASQDESGVLAWPLWVRATQQVRTAAELEAAAANLQSVPVAELAWHALLVPAATVRELGPPRAELFMWYEDVEFGLRIRRAGRELLVVPRAVVHHPPPPPGRRVRLGRIALDVPRTTPWRAYLMIRNSLVVRHEHNGMRFWWTDLPLLVITAVAATWDLPVRRTWAARHVLLRAWRDAVRGRLGPPPDDLWEAG